VRKRAENDLQLVANRIALLRYEEQVRVCVRNYGYVCIYVGFLRECVILSPVGKSLNQLDNNVAHAIPVWYADHMFVLSLCAESLRESY
jgi:hypothetical protein